jgi:cation:H+ antiporter
MLENIFILFLSLFLIIKSSTEATKYSARLAENFHLSRYIVAFIIVAIISVFPEAIISINSAIEGIPSFGLGTLFGSNIADLTLVFAIIVLFSGRSLRIESKFLKNNIFFPFLLLIPILLGLNGYYTRPEGIVLILTGVIFYALSFRNSLSESGATINQIPKLSTLKNFLILLFFIGLLIVGAHFTVSSATDLASFLGISPILIGMFITGLGTVIPELVYSIQSVRKNHDSLAIGDILGTVLADATVIVGIMAVIKPFYFPQRIIYIAGTFMVISSFLLFYFMHTDKKLSRKESYVLIIFWVLFITLELILNL